MLIQNHRHFQISAIIIIILAIVANLFLLASQKVFARNIGVVQIAGTNLVGRTISQAKTILEGDLWTYSQKGIQLNLNDQQFNPTLEQIGVIFNSERLANEALYYGKNGDVFLKFIQSSRMLIGGENLPLTSGIDKAKLYSYLDFVGASEIQKSKDASLKFSDSQFNIIPEENGQNIDRQALPGQITARLAQVKNIQNTNKADVDLRIVESEPRIKQADLIQAQTSANQLITTPYVFSYQNKTFTTTGADLAKWITFKSIKGEIKPQIDDSAVTKYLDQIAYHVNTPVTNKVVEIVKNKKVTKTEGKPGTALNTSLALASIKQSFESGERKVTLNTQVVNPKEVIVYPDTPPTGGMFPGKYIEINISTKQRMYLWDGKKHIATFIVSSGRPGLLTPTGIFHIMSKSVRAYSKKYGLYMPYWNQFTSMGHGIHELPEWPGGYKEGANHLGIRVSHGCVRLGVGPAAFLYYWAPIGTPIYIHY